MKDNELIIKEKQKTHFFKFDTRRERDRALFYVWSLCKKHIATTPATRKIRKK